jgi:hypothetical protein
MKRTTVLTLLAFTCSLAISRTAEARYQDGMSLYQYVKSQPSSRDPAGLGDQVTGMEGGTLAQQHDCRQYLYAYTHGDPTYQGPYYVDPVPDEGLADDPKAASRSNDILKKMDEEKRQGGLTEATIREATEPNRGKNCPKGICPCALTWDKALRGGCDTDPAWVTRWLHPGATHSCKKEGTWRSRGNQCTYDAAGSLITHGPAAGTPDLFGGHNLGTLGDHWDRDVKDLNTALQRTGGRKTGGTSVFKRDAIIYWLTGEVNEQRDYDRSMNAIEGWEDILRYQNTRGGFYRACVPDDAPENWGNWEFKDGTLHYTGATPRPPAP